LQIVQNQSIYNSGIQLGKIGSKQLPTATIGYQYNLYITRGAHGIIVVYDITDRISFENVISWMSDIEKFKT
jgi:hypothetical protein